MPHYAASITIYNHTQVYFSHVPPLNPTHDIK